MARFMVNLAAVIVLATAWGPGPAVAESVAYMKALAEYYQATAEVKQTQAKLNQAQAAQAQAQAKYDKANALYTQILGKYRALGDKLESLTKQQSEIADKMGKLGYFDGSEHRRLTAEFNRLEREWNRAMEAQKNLDSPLDHRRNELGKAHAALNQAKRDVNDAQNELSRAKQRQLLALRALQRLRAQGQQQVSYNLQFGAGAYDYPPWLLQILERWNQNRLPGSSIHIHYHQ